MTLLEDAENALLARKYHAALELYKSASRDSPQNPRIYQGIAQSLYELHDYDAAIANCEKALKLGPNLPAPHIIYSYIYLRRGDLDASKREALEALRLGPENPESLLCYGTFLLAARDDDNAIRNLQKAIRGAPSNWKAHYNLALAHLRKREMRQYLIEKKLVLRLAPSFQNILEFLFAYAVAHQTETSVISVGILAVALLFRIPYLLLVPTLSITLVLVMGIYLVFRQRSRRGALMIFYSICTYILLYALFEWIFK